jgi:hypothetical protein
MIHPIRADNLRYGANQLTGMPMVAVISPKEKGHIGPWSMLCSASCRTTVPLFPLCSL